MICLHQDLTETRMTWDHKMTKNREIFTRLLQLNTGFQLNVSQLEN